MKEYTFEEVIANIKEGEEYKSTEKLWVIKSIKKIDGQNRFYFDGEEKEHIGNNPQQRFIKVEMPINFMEVVETNKICRVEHPLIAKILNDDITLREFDNDEVEYNWFLRYKKEGYLQLNLLMNVIMCFLNVREFKEVIKDGKWYISNKEDIDMRF